MNKQLLHEYLLFLLSADKAAIIIQEGNAENIISITTEIIKAVQYLPPYFAMPVLEKLSDISKINQDATIITVSEINRIKKAQKWQKAFPWLIALTTLSIIIAMYFFSKK